MGIGEACAEAWITLQSFNLWRRSDPSLDKLIEQVDEASMDMMRDLSQNIIQDGLTWITKLRPNEKIQLAKWALEKTSPEFNPAVKVESKNLNVDVTMTDEEIIQRLKDLWINNISNVNSSTPTYTEGSGADEETTSS
jgi:ribosomal protein S7